MAVARPGAGKPSCPETGLSVPECSCRSCLEAMLRQFRPTLLADQIKVTRTRPSDDARARPEAA